jgi:putative aldouronate transport system substrate-binding protein
MDEKMWIYKPWLDQLGLAMPQTTEEYAAVLRAFKEQDPNGSGEADEWPLASSIDNWNGDLDLFFVNSFTFHPNEPWLYLNEGTVTASYVQDGWREAVKYLAGLYAEGLIAPETFTQDSEQLRQMVDNADAALVGCAPCGWKGGISGTSMTEADSRILGYVTMPPLAGPDGVRFATYNPYVAYTTGYFLVTNKCENPELAVRWADGMYEFETSIRSVTGVKDRDWRWANEGEVGINGEPAIWAGLDSAEGQESPPNTSWGQTGPSFRSNAFRLGEAIDPAEAATHLEVILYNETNTNYEPYKQPEEMAMPPLWFTEEQAAQVADLTSTIENYVRETFALAITGQTDIEGEWENYLATLEGMGLQQFIQVHQEAYDAKYGG